MAIEEEETDKGKLFTSSNGKTLTFDILAKIVAAGGKVSINGVSMTEEELLLFAEAAHQGFGFCFTRQ
jgi:hypothetical protein